MLKNIARNFSYLFFGQGLSGLLSIASVLWIAKMLGPENFGKYGFVESIVNFGLIAAAFGTDLLGNREASRNMPSTGLLASVIVPLRAITSVVIFVLVIALVVIMKKTADVVLLTVICGAGIIVSPFFFGWIFQAAQKMQYIALGNLIREAVFLILSIVLLKLTKGNVLAVGASFAASRIAFAIFWTGALNRLKIITADGYRLRLELGLKHLKGIARQSLSLWYATLVGVAVAGIDVFCISLMSGDEATGMYGASYKLIFFMTMVPVIYTMAVFPVMTRAWQEDKGAFARNFNVSMAGLMMFFIPYVPVFYLYGQDIVRFIYGEKYAGGENYLFMLSIYLVFFSMNTYLSKIIVITSSNRAITAISTVGLCLNVLLIPLFTKYKGAMGAAEGRVVADSLTLLAFSYQLSGVLSIKSVIKVAMRFGLSLSALAFTIVLIGQYPAPDLFVRTVLPILAYYLIAFKPIVNAFKGKTLY